MLFKASPSILRNIASVSRWSYKVSIKLNGRQPDGLLCPFSYWGVATRWKYYSSSCASLNKNCRKRGTFLNLIAPAPISLPTKVLTTDYLSIFSQVLQPAVVWESDIGSHTITTKSRTCILMVGWGTDQKYLWLSPSCFCPVLQAVKLQELAKVSWPKGASKGPRPRSWNRPVKVNTEKALIGTFPSR